MKKIISLCLVALMLALCFVSCAEDKNDTEETSAPAKVESSDATEDTTAPTNTGKDNDEMTAERYAKAYDAAANKVFTPLEAPSATSLVRPMSFNDPSAENNSNYYAVGAYLLFLRNLYETEGYEITEEAVKVSATCKMTVNGQEAEMKENFVMRSYRTEDGMLRNDLHSADPNRAGTYMVMRIDVDYDFATDVLSGFDMSLMLISNGEVMQFEYFVYDGTTVKILDNDVKDDDYNNAVKVAEERRDDIVSRLAGAKDIGDYSEQYTNAMKEQVRRAYPDVTVTSYRFAA